MGAGALASACNDAGEVPDSVQPQEAPGTVATSVRAVEPEPSAPTPAGPDARDGADAEAHAEGAVPTPSRPTDRAPTPAPMPPAAEAVAGLGTAGSAKGGGGSMRSKRSRHRGALAPARFAPPGHFAPPSYGGEGYDVLPENAFVAVSDDPRSTFSIDVDTASFSNVRRLIEDGRRPPAEAVRIEELVNYFSYEHPTPRGSDPFAVSAEVNRTPWNDRTLLVSIGLQGKKIDSREMPARNLVFLLDVSGSMSDPDKLPLLKTALSMLVDNLRDQDRVSIVVYAGASGVVLEPTMGSDKPRIADALRRLEAGGSTNGGQGIQLAYTMARRNFAERGINRVVLATDGDFNVGLTDRSSLMQLIEEERRSGVFLSVLGFGTGNLQDATMEQLADKGNGNYAYIDSEAEARKVLVEEAGGTLVTLAKDVKIQVEFNPAEVESYRLIGYENRKLAHADFNDDRKDAGEVGAGHSVTALYEVTPKRSATTPPTDPLKYQQHRGLTARAGSGELLTVKVRSKAPQGTTSTLLTLPISEQNHRRPRPSADFRFAAAVAEFGMLLQRSPHKGSSSYAHVLRLAGDAVGPDPHGHRRSFLELVRKAERLHERPR